MPVRATIAPLRLLLPTLPSVFIANARFSNPQRPAAERAADWTERTTSPEQRAVAVLAYETATARVNGLEAKGVGVLQACAVVAAGALVACASKSGPAQVLGVFALLYLTLAGWACCQVLVPSPRDSVTPGDIGHEHAYARIAAYTESLSPVSGRIANLVTGAAYDLARASAMTLAALLLVTF